MAIDTPHVDQDTPAPKSPFASASKRDERLCTTIYRATDYLGLCYYLRFTPSNNEVVIPARDDAQMALLQRVVQIERLDRPQHFYTDYPFVATVSEPHNNRANGKLIDVREATPADFAKAQLGNGGDRRHGQEKHEMATKKTYLFPVTDAERSELLKEARNRMAKAHIDAERQEGDDFLKAVEGVGSILHVLTGQAKSKGKAESFIAALSLALNAHIANSKPSDVQALENVQANKEFNDITGEREPEPAKTVQEPPEEKPAETNEHPNHKRAAAFQIARERSGLRKEDKAHIEPLRALFREVFGMSLDEAIEILSVADIKAKMNDHYDNAPAKAPEPTVQVGAIAVNGATGVSTPANNETALKASSEVKAQPETVEAEPTTTAITIIDQKPKSVTIEKVQPNRFWLTSPAWQINPFDMAKFVAGSKLFKNADTPDKALAIMFKGVTLGVDPMAALEHINIIGDGKPPTIDGALMLALLRKEGISVKFVERTATRVTITMTRPDNQDTVTVTWTIEQANNAGLTRQWNRQENKYTDKPTWKNYPTAMLTWRAVSEAARLIASDIMIFGGIPMYTHEEIDPDVVVNEDGSIAA